MAYCLSERRSLESLKRETFRVIKKARGVRVLVVYAMLCGESMCWNISGLMGQPPLWAREV